MRGVQSGWLGKERNFLVIPVDENMARCGEDVGGATLQINKMIFISFLFWRRLTLRRRPVLSASIVRNSIVEENVGRL